jgi:glycosyltransferase involved in cell wall biosynthesis
MKVTAITPTADRPLGLALCEKFMARQTLRPDEWIVADGGSNPAPITMRQMHLYDPRPAGAENFAHNLLNALACASGEAIVFIEDDDWYAPDHIERTVAALQRPGALLSGDDSQRYYNVAHRCWRTFQNVGASMCQTGMRRAAIEIMRSVIMQCLQRRSYGIDTNLWRAVPTSRWALTGAFTALGIKGLPGQAGLGIGHRPAGNKWNRDPDLIELRRLIGTDAWLYSTFGAG